MCLVPSAATDWPLRTRLSYPGPGPLCLAQSPQTTLSGATSPFLGYQLFSWSSVRQRQGNGGYILPIQ